MHCEATKKSWLSPGWCDSVDWALAWEPKGLWFNSQSEHMASQGTSWLQVRSPEGGAQRQPHNDISLCLFLPPFLFYKQTNKQTKSLLKKKEKKRWLIRMTSYIYPRGIKKSVSASHIQEWKKYREDDYLQFTNDSSSLINIYTPHSSKIGKDLVIKLNALQFLDSFLLVLPISNATILDLII